MGAFAWLAPTMLSVAMLSGCMLPFCGPTEYHLSAVVASTNFHDEPWDLERAEAGLRAAGFEPSGGTELSVQGQDGNVTMTVNGGTAGTRAAVVFPVNQGGFSKAEVDRLAEQIIIEREAEAAERLSDFERGANWTRDREIAWDVGTLHGDC